MTTDESLDISVILPVYNEVGHVTDEVDRITASLDANGASYEIIIVDDGSDDGSGDVVREIASRRPDVRLITFSSNRGSGSARRAGTQAARGETVVWTDADMSYPNDRIPELVKGLDGFDQIVGARTSEQGTKKLMRVPAKYSIRKLAEFLTETKIPDLNSGLRAFRRSVALQYLHLLPAGFSCVTTMTMAFLANGYSIRYVPIDYKTRSGNSKFHWWADTRRYLTQVLRMVLSYNPLRFFLPAGLILFALACAKLVFDWTTRDFRLSTNTLLVFFAAFQVVILGLLADLVVRVNRPQQQVEPARY